MKFPVCRLSTDEQLDLLCELLEALLDNPHAEQDVLSALSEHLTMSQVDELNTRLP